VVDSTVEEVAYADQRNSLVKIVTWLHDAIVDRVIFADQRHERLLRKPLRVCPETLSRIAELSQHEADRCELEEGEGVAG
jgi:hypothetical protein